MRKMKSPSNQITPADEKREKKRREYYSFKKINVD